MIWLGGVVIAIDAVIGIVIDANIGIVIGAVIDAVIGVVIGVVIDSVIGVIERKKEKKKERSENLLKIVLKLD